jgi:hypothetical protein
MRMRPLETWVTGIRTWWLARVFGWRPIYAVGQSVQFPARAQLTPRDAHFLLGIVETQFFLVSFDSISRQTFKDGGGEKIDDV